MEPWIVVALITAAFAAGFVDAAVGGGGLILLPALLLAPGVSPVEALATNKSVAICGTSVSATTYFRRVRPALSTAIPTAALAACFAGLGAWTAASVPSDVLKPVILVALMGAGVYTLLRPELGEDTVFRFGPRKHRALVLLAGGLVGFYDGIAGPGTGAFLLFILVGGLGYAFLEASANAKIINLGTNLGALIVFSLAGSVVWALSLPMAVANIAGGYLGTRVAISAGSRFIRRVFLVIVTVLVARLAWDILDSLGG